MSYLKHSIRILLGLYIAGCTLIVSLWLLGGVALFTKIWSGKNAETENVTLIEWQIRRALEVELARVPKQFSLAGIDRGQWSLICLAGAGTPGNRIAAAIEANSVPFNAIDVKNALPTKSASTVVVIQKDGRVRQFWPNALRWPKLIGGGETICVTPDNPVLTLPTEAARQALK
jgi:hypothetical protein